VTRDEFMGIIVGSLFDDMIGAFRRQAGQTRQLFPAGFVDVERIIPAPAFAHALRDGFRILFQFGGGLSSFLP